MAYKPEPLDVSSIEWDDSLNELIELLARNIHDAWASARMQEGWVYGPQRDDQKKTHPCLVPYEMLPQSEREYDRISARSTLGSIIALGYRIERADQPL